jgi:hypothetical protein
MRIDQRFISLVAVTAVVTAGCGSSSSSSSGGGGGATATLGAAIIAVVSAQSATLAAPSCENWSAVQVSYMNAYGARMAATLQAEADAGRLTYSRTAADACLAAVQAQTCAQSRAGMPPVCNTAFVGTVAAGGACSTQDACGATAWCNTSSTCPGICMAGLANGATCSGDLFCASKYCDFTNSWCAAALPTGATNGAACGTGKNNQCAPGLYCDAGAGTCLPLEVAGGPCSSSSSCAAGLSCDGGGFCRAMAAIGGSCVTTGCPAGAYCSTAAGDKCAEYPSTAGVSCSEAGFCLSQTLNCTGTPPVCTAVTLSACWM